jgi:hypothetical protein
VDDLDVEMTTLPHNGGVNDAFVLLMQGQSPAWSHGWGGMEVDSVRAVAFDAAANAYLVGNFQNRIDIAGPHNGSGSQSMFVVKLAY